MKEQTLYQKINALDKILLNLKKLGTNCKRKVLNL